MPTSFTYRSSRSAGFLIGILIAVGVETIAIHLLFYASHPVISWIVVWLSILSGFWIAADYRARGSRALQLESERLELRIGLRPSFYLSLDSIAEVARANWKDIPQQDPQYINLTAPAQPNVLLKLREQVRVPIALGLKRRATQLGLHVDEPDEFVSCIRNVAGIGTEMKARS